MLETSAVMGLLMQIGLQEKDIGQEHKFAKLVENIVQLNISEIKAIHKINKENKQAKPIEQSEAFFKQERLY